jgi:DNA-binding NarL/FixJ family response regulator
MQEEVDGSERAIKVVLADDRSLFRQGLAGILDSLGGMQVVGQTENDQEAIALARKQNPNVVILQVQMPLERAKKALEQIREVSSPPPKVVLVAMFDDPNYVQEFLKLGVSAYLLKSASIEQLIGAIRGAALDPTGQNVIVGMPREKLEHAEDGSGGVLSARETEILLLAARGLSNRRIASRIQLSEATVKRHLSNAYEKMNVHSRGEATRKALSENWITIREVTQEEEDGADPLTESEL